MRSPVGAVSTLIGSLSAPSYLFPDPDGDLYIAETGADRVTCSPPPGPPPSCPWLSRWRLCATARGIYMWPRTAPHKSCDSVRQAGARRSARHWVSPPVSRWTPAEISWWPTRCTTIVSISPAGVATTLAGTGAAGFAGDGGAAAALLCSVVHRTQSGQPGKRFHRGHRQQPHPAAHAAGRGRRIVPARRKRGQLSQPDPFPPTKCVCLFGAFDPSSITVQVDGQPATLFYASATQINLLVPDTT